MAGERGNGGRFHGGRACLFPRRLHVGVTHFNMNLTASHVESSMERQQSVEYALYIAAARDDIGEYQRHLEETQRDIAQAERAIEDLTIDAATMRVRMKELELDEELVKRSEDEAIMEKIIAQKRLAEIGGLESAVRGLQKALDEARRELEATKDETQSAIAEEKKMELEIGKLGVILQRTRANSVKLQEEYSSVMRGKRETDAKLKQLCMFLQTDAPLSPASVSSDASTAAASSPRPTSPRVVLQLGEGVEVAVPEVSF